MNINVRRLWGMREKGRGIEDDGVNNIEVHYDV
jgi:hypothetical protein